MKKQHELLLPVGSFESVVSAINNYADAIYIGAPQFNARGRSTQFSFEELKNIIDLCHRSNVKVYLAFNILIFQEELMTLQSYLEELTALEADALIVQDIGLVYLLQKLVPKQRVHASTQMTVTDDLSIKLLSDLEIKRFVLARELSLKEIKHVRDNTKAELEVFVHGALCVAYSGQCFTSEAIGGRSANRGQCAQSCRLSYKLVVDGETRDLGDKSYLVSPKDLCGLEDLPKLIEIGIDSFKVEGRLKSPDYVAQTGQSYHDMIVRTQNETLDKIDIKNEISKLSRTYSRGFFTGWLNGVDHQKLVDGTYSEHRGEFCGELFSAESQNKNLLVKSHLVLKEGMGILITWDFQGEVFEKGGKIAHTLLQKSDEKAKGKNIYLVRLWEKDRTEKKMNAPKGARVYITDDPELSIALKKTYENKQVRRKKSIALKAIFSDEVQFFWENSTDCKQYVLTMPWNDFLGEENVLRNDLSEKDKLFIREELLKGSSSDYAIESLDITIECFLGQFNQKRLRHIKNRILGLIEEKEKNNGKAFVKTNAFGVFDSFFSKNHIRKEIDRKLLMTLLLRSKDHVQYFILWISENPIYRQCIESIILDFDHGSDYQYALQSIREVGIICGVATTRILKPKEYVHLEYIKRLAPDYILVRNLGAIHYYQDSGIPLRSDFSLNITNSLSFNYFKAKGLESLCLSYDLNVKQLIGLVPYIDTNSVEVTIHQYLPLFHMEHCVFAGFMSTGSSFKDCGRPCEKHKVELIDHYGNHHYLKADQECRNTMFHGTPQSGLSFIHQLADHGVRRFRIEFLDENQEQFFKKLQVFSDFFRGQKSASMTLKELNLAENYGVARGTLAR
jgi:U32 family peptidase